jgi:16S rRNA (cytidine1402-2'-O)-methyltransferase
MGTLYLVATPIGNLEDISQRALKILGSVSLIAAEDTRVTRHLLSAFDIHTPLTSYYEHNKLTKLDTILSALGEGSVALVSDAGTPGINDPGYELVRTALAAGHTVSPIPGPSAPISALIASGLASDSFLYLGYLPRKAGERRRLIAEQAAVPHTLIFLEAPHRLLDSLQDLVNGLGDRPAAIARELTKLHEEIYRGSLREAIEHFTLQPPRGEFTLVVQGSPAMQQIWDESELETAIAASLAQDLPPGEIAQQLAARSGWPRREIYRKITQA